MSQPNCGSYSYCTGTQCYSSGSPAWVQTTVTFHGYQCQHASESHSCSC